MAKTAARKTGKLLLEPPLALPNSHEQDCLVGLDAIEEDDSLAFEVMESGTVTLRSMRDINVFETNVAESQHTTQELLNSLDDLKCPRYFEQQVTQMQIIDPQNRFVSCFKGKLVYEIKFTTSTPDPYSVYNIKLLLRLKDKAAFAELIGVVVDKLGSSLQAPSSTFRSHTRDLHR